MNKRAYALLLAAILAIDCWSQTSEPAHEPQISGCGSADSQQVRVGDKNLVGGHLIHKVQPKYPKAARKAHVEGTVVLCAEIQKDGKIGDLRPLSGPSELIDSAMKAVQKWVYTPFLLNGEPTIVETDIRLAFQLD
jgi:periplasmic protein TonB